MKYSFIVAILVSTVIHVGLILFVALHNWHVEMPFGDGIVTVDIVGGGNDTIITGVPPKGVGRLLGGRPSTQFNNPPIPPLEKGGQGGFGNNSATNYGSPSGNPILTHIRAKIERTKYYPAIAKRQGIVGRPEVSFQINPDGSATNIKVIRSSGNQILDSAAVETIKMATPYPSYSDPISLSINFSLD